MSRSGVGSNAGGIPLPGHDHRGELPHWDHPLGAGGGVEATIGDLARYASACLRPPPSPLGAAITAAQTPQLPVEAGGHQALAWRVSDDGIRWHTGSTGGFSAAVLINPVRNRAIAMLASCFGRGRSLRQAGLLTLAGADPRAARPQPPGPEWDERAREMIRLLLDGRVTEIAARASDAVRGTDVRRAVGPALARPGLVTLASPPVSRSAAGGQTAGSWPTPRSRSPTARSGCGSASSRRAWSQA